MWVASMRNRRDELNSYRHSRLATIGFIWNPFDQQWEEMVSKLEDYRQAQVDCLVPQLSLILIKYPDSSPLDSFGMLMTDNGRKCLPSSRNTTKNKGIASFHDTTKRILHLVSGL
jgi:hypothetical protein